jgi:hypothetical protein
MSQFFENIGNLVNMSNFSKTVTQTAPSTNTLVLYLLAGFVILVIVLMLLGIKIDWSSLDPRPLSWQITQEGTLYWPPSLIYSNLKVDSPVLIEPTNYSSSTDLVLYNTRSYTANSPQRHIFHRGSSDISTSTGLPTRMNPGLILDNNLNDLLVYVDTQLGAEIYRESVRIVDVPMDIPLRIQIVVKGQVVEVYLNCKLEFTKVLSGLPLNVENAWYGLSGASAAQAQIQNLYVWDRALTSREVATICGGKLPNFAAQRPVCDMSGPVAAALTGGGN